ncbi:MAG: hypothetical protein H0X38_00135 [Planctomycetes bacterium]|nr:hypothetical protein [Planctomycetota bacterium]
MAKRPTTHSTTPTAAPTERDAVIASIAQSHLGLETMESRNQDRLDFQEHSCLSIRDALRAAFDAGRKSTRRPARTATAIVGDLVLTSAKPTDGTPGWATGRVGAFRFCAKVYAGHALVPSYEIGRSRISKLELRRLDTDAVAYAWDRGLDIPAADTAAQAAVDSLAKHLAEHLYGAASVG